MKQYRKIFLILLFASYSWYGMTQELKSHKLTPEEIKANQKITVAPNVGSGLSPAAKTKAVDRGHAMSALILKAILHRTDPTSYPVDLKPNSVEKNIQAAVDKISKASFDSISAKAKLTLADPKKRATALGKLKELDFQQVSLLQEIKRKTNVEYKAVSTIPEFTTQKSIFNKVDINIRNVDCIARTTLADPYDQTVLSGLLVGASGNTNDANSIIGCEMIDGLTCDYGGYRFGTYSMNTTAGFPKTFYCVFVLITSIQEDPAGTRDYFDALMSMISAAAVPDDGLEVIAAAVSNCITDLTSEWINIGRPLKPYAVKFQLNNAYITSVNNGATNDLQTGDIVEFGYPDRWGKYRIKFFWQLRK